MCSHSTRHQRHALISMISEEPFRIFFPLGLVAGVIGLLLWPLYIWGFWSSYPLPAHSRLMVQGFMGSFIFGFLGTAGPRLTGARHISPLELTQMLLLQVAALGSHLAGQQMIGDILFFALLARFLVSLGSRFADGDSLPPPNFVLVALGLLSAFVGIGLVLLSHGNAALAGEYAFGNLLLNQGFVLFPVLGVGVFLFPRLLGITPMMELSETRQFTPWWIRNAITAGAAGVLIMGSFVWESLGEVRGAGALRFAIAATYIATQMPAVLGFGRCPFLGKCVRASTWMLLLGLLWPVFLPAYRVAGLHLLFIGGFMIVTFTVATRVMLGHSGQSHLFKRPLPFLIAASVLLLIGLGARIGADFMPSLAGRNTHLAYAALLCIAAALVWGIRLIPHALTPDTED